MSLLSTFLRGSRRIPMLLQTVGQIRESSYKSSLFLEDIDPVPRQYDITRDSVDWEYVQRALAPITVPEPPKKDVYPSGWQPQAESLTDRPYYVARSKNHQIPVYLFISNLKDNRRTIVRHIRGDIWLLEKELKAFLQPQSKRTLRVQVNEFAGLIRIQGDHVNAIKYFLQKKGY